jgi:hypothetical protein
VKRRYDVAPNGRSVWRSGYALRLLRHDCATIRRSLERRLRGVADWLHNFVAFLDVEGAPLTRSTLCSLSRGSFLSVELR